MHFDYLVEDKDAEANCWDDSSAHDIYRKHDHPSFGVGIVPPIVLHPNNQQEDIQIDLY